MQPVRSNPHTSHYVHPDYPTLHWSPSAAYAFSGVPTEHGQPYLEYLQPLRVASSPFDATQNRFEQPTPYLEYSLSQSVDHGTSVNHYTSNNNSFSMAPQHGQPISLSASNHSRLGRLHLSPPKADLSSRLRIPNLN